MDFDDEETPLPSLFEESNQDPRARQWRNRELEYLAQIEKLKEECKGLRIKVAKASLEINRLRKLKGSTA